MKSNLLTWRTGNARTIDIWTIVESEMYLVAACSIAMRPVIEVMIPRLIKDYTKIIMHKFARGFTPAATVNNANDAQNRGLELGTWSSRRRLREGSLGRLDGDGNPTSSKLGTLAADDTIHEEEPHVDAIAWSGREFEDINSIRSNT